MQRENRMRFLYTLLLSLVVALSGCVNNIDNSNDTTYLTPIPNATIAAYRAGEPITNRLQAVIYARAMIDTTRLHYLEEPKVVSADEVTLEYAKSQRLSAPSYENDDRLGNTKVWFVVFQGVWQVIPPDPDHNITPEPPFEGCVFVIIDKKDIMRTELGGAKCASKN